MQGEFKLMGIKLGGGGVTYAGTYKATEEVLEASRGVDLEMVSQLATISAGVATAVYFVIMAGYMIWKWRHEARGKQ